MIQADIVIVGAGIAGASLAARIGGAASVVLLEAESQPGYHSTGRSAAFFAETYGGPAVQPLSTASRDFFLSPPPGFADVPLTHDRGAMHIATPADLPMLDAMDRDFAASGVTLHPLDRDAMLARVPLLGPQWVAGRLEPGCRDIDVAALHGGFLAEARRAGATVLTDAQLMAAGRDGGRWRLDTKAGPVTADLLVNAAGAWADEVGRLVGARPLRLTPFRRTMAQLIVDPPAPPSLPVVMDAAGSFYFRPEAGGRVWLSPHDEIPQPPGDAAPEEIDVAIAIDRFEQATAGWRVQRVERRWAGLRTFAPDRVPVYGFDPEVPGLFWCAGQGGFGIQTAPAASLLAASLLLGRRDRAPVDPVPYAPERFAVT